MACYFEIPDPYGDWDNLYYIIHDQYGKQDSSLDWGEYQHQQLTMIAKYLLMHTAKDT